MHVVTEANLPFVVLPVVIGLAFLAGILFTTHLRTFGIILSLLANSWAVWLWQDIYSYVDLWSPDVLYQLIPGVDAALVGFATVLVFINSYSKSV